MKADSNLERVLRAGHFAITAEIGPPKSTNRAVLDRKCALVRDYVDAVNLTDNQSAVVRMASWASSLICLQNGVEPVMQVACRDRNRIALQADFLGASALGIKNILCLTGDHTRFGDHPHAKPVFDLDSITLLQVVRHMRDDKVFMSGQAIKKEPRFFIGAVENPFAEPFDFRVVRLAKKVKAGAEFLQTQLIFNVEKFARWMEQVRDWGLHEQIYILAGLGPLKTARAAEYMRDQVPGVEIPDEIVRRMQSARDQAQEGVQICLEIIEQVRAIEGVAGLHIMPIIDFEESIPEIVKAIGCYPRPRLAPAEPAAAAT